MKVGLLFGITENYKINRAIQMQAIHNAIDASEELGHEVSIDTEGNVQ